MINSTNLHLEIQYSQTPNPVGIIRSSYRDKGKVKHKQFGRIKGKSLNELKMLQLAFANKVVASHSPDSLQIKESKEYGASFVILEIIKQIGLDKVIYSHSTPWLKDILAMIAGRIIYAGSKLSLCNQYSISCLWELCGVDGRPEVKKHCYSSLDKLRSRQKSIQKSLSNKHIKKGHLVLYDITSSYLEGEYKESELVQYGYSRDCKNKHEQIVIGLLCSSEGCPVGVEVFPGNTKDASTVIDKVKEIKNSYDIDKIIFVGDRGMVTQTTAEQLEEKEGILTIGALTRNEITCLLDRRVIQPSLFDTQDIVEIVDPDILGKRYCLCKNPLSADRALATRNRLLELTSQDLDDIVFYKRQVTVEVLGARIGKVLQKYKMGKYIDWSISRDKENERSTKHKITWSINPQKIAEAKRLDGCYIITTKVQKEEMDKHTVVASYRRLQLVEQAFRNLKTTQLEVRPIYHKLDSRIEAHVFLCMLAYYVQWHIKKRLQDLFDKDEKNSKRRWTFENVIESLRQITRNEVSMHGASFYRNTTPNQEQKEILKLLKVNL